MRQNSRESSEGRPLLVNGKFLAHAVTGTERYAEEILRALSASGVRYEILLPHNARVPDWLPRADIKRSRAAGLFFEQLVLPVKAWRRMLLNLGGPAPLLARRQAAVLFDASPFRYPQAYSLKFRAWYYAMFWLLLKRKTIIYTISHFSARELSQVFRVPVARFQIATCSGDHFKRLDPVAPKIQAELGEHPFMLVVGTVAPHKNVAPMLKALTEAGLRVVVTGGKGLRDIFASTTEAIDSPHVIMAGRLSDSELAWLYDRATALVFPSLYEGFGLPIVEAQSRSCAVISSNLGAMPEVAGNGALLFNGHDVNEGVRYALKLTNDPQLRAHWARMGEINAKRFNWSKTADCILQGMLRVVVDDDGKSN